MPTPTNTIIKTSIVSNLPANFKHIGNEGTVSNGLTTQTDSIVDEISNKLASSWNTFASSVTFDNAMVIGLGIGAWVGNGVGGIFSNTELSMNATNPFTGGKAGDLTDAINSALNEQFNLWASTYLINGVSFVGTSTALPIVPGVFTANAIPMLISAAGFGTIPIGSGLKIIANLPFITPDLTSFCNAIGDAFESNFNNWLNTSQLNAGSATGPAAPGAGSGFGLSVGGTLL